MGEEGGCSPFFLVYPSFVTVLKLKKYTVRFVVVLLVFTQKFAISNKKKRVKFDYISTTHDYTPNIKQTVATFVHIGPYRLNWARIIL